MPNYWGVRVGEGSRYAEIARKGDFVGIGWEETGNLAWLAAMESHEVARAKILKHLEDTYGVTGMKVRLDAGQVARFVREIVVGDIVFMPNTPIGLVHIGRVSSGYSFTATPTDGCPYLSRRTVEWLKDVPRSELPPGLLSSLGALTTIFSLERRAEEAEAVVYGHNGGGTPPIPTRDVVEHVLSRLHGLSPKDFESFVADFLGAVGFEAQAIGKSGDGGIDVVGTLNAQGLAQVLLRVQVKRTKSSVGNDAVLKTRGALAVDEQGAIITLGGFTAQARREAECEGKKTIVLVEGEAFVEMVLDNWTKLRPATQALVGVRERDMLPVRERFLVVAEPTA